MTKKTSSAKQILGGVALVLFILFGAYSFYWFQTAEATKESYVKELSKLGNGANVTEPEISGFPGKMVVRKTKESIASDSGTLEINNLEAQSWPFPDMPIEINTSKVVMRSSRWVEGLQFDSFRAVMRVNQDRVEFQDSALKQRDFEAQVRGNVDISDPDVAIPDLVVTLSNHEDFLSVLVDSGIIEDNAAKFVGFGMAALMNKDKKVEVPIYAKNGMINLGPLPIIKLPTSQKAPKRQKPIIPQDSR